MWWLTLRLQRAELILLLVATVAIGAALVATADEAELQNRPYTNEECPVPLTPAGPEAFYCYVEPSELFRWVEPGIDFLLLVPLVVTLLLGIPVLMELRDRSFRLVWTQSRTRAEWARSRLALILLVGFAVTAASILATRWWVPAERNFWSSIRPFDLSGIVSFGWVVFAVGLTLAAGTAIRRPLIALVVSAVTFVFARLVFREEIRPALIPPETARTELFGPQVDNAWVLDTWYVAVDGSRIIEREMGELCQQTGLVMNEEQARAQNDAYFACVDANSMGFAYQYQPESRYWPLQFVETGIFALIGIALIAWVVWYWLRRLE